MWYILVLYTHRSFEMLVLKKDEDFKVYMYFVTYFSENQELPEWTSQFSIIPHERLKYNVQNPTLKATV